MTATLEDNSRSGETESDAGHPKPFQIESYADLLQFPEIAISAKATPSGSRNITVPLVDAIVVPTIRSAGQVHSAVQLAADARCPLIPIYTDNFPAGLPSILAQLKHDKVKPLALRSDVHDRLLDLGADLPRGRESSCALDISRKRNLGLLIGRACGWTRMLFLDDDIRKLGVARLSSAAALLDKFPVVALQVNKYPDASAVGHARRLTGRRQEPFISGGSLLINPQLLNGFFPPIYHEDWICIINHLRRGEVAVGGTVGQLPYQPFTTPNRAKLEEFGEILVSGLLWMIYSSRGSNFPEPASVLNPTADYDYWREATRPQFWENILKHRAALLDSISTRLEELNPGDGAPRQSVEAAKGRCAELTADEFTLFTKRWLGSLAVWRHRLERLPKVHSVEKALSELGVGHAVRTYEGGYPQVRASQQAPVSRQTPASEPLSRLPASGAAPARSLRWSGGFVGQRGRLTANGRGRFGWRSWRLPH